MLQMKLDCKKSTVGSGLVIVFATANDCSVFAKLIKSNLCKIIFKNPVKIHQSILAAISVTAQSALGKQIVVLRQVFSLFYCEMLCTSTLNCFQILSRNSCYFMIYIIG